MEGFTDEEIMQQVAKGDLDRMRYLFDRYHLRIYNYALQLTHNQEVSKDITQEVFYKIIKHRDTFKQAKFSSWIYTIARNLCHDYHKSLRKQEQQLSDLRSLNDILIARSQERFGCTEQLIKALNSLSIKDRELIIMSRFHGLKYQEIAEITNSNVGALKTKMHRVLKKLKDHYFSTAK
ncbi:MAG: RNA polymerase sigma factor [Bacteroidota bacterium]